MKCHSILRRKLMVLRSTIPIWEWVKIPREAWAGLPMERKVFQLKWYFSEFLKGAKLIAQGTAPVVSEHILVSIIQSQVLITLNTSPPQKQVPIGTWGSSKYSPSLVNAWFTDGSATTKSNVVCWKAAAFRPKDRMVLIEEGKSKSAQHVEVITALLLAKQSHKDGKHLHLFTDSWCMTSWIAIWPEIIEINKVENQWKRLMV